MNFISMIDYVKLKSKILIFLSIFAIFFITISFSDYVKPDMDQFYSEIKTKRKKSKFFRKQFIYKTLQVRIMMFLK